MPIWIRMLTNPQETTRLALADPHPLQAILKITLTPAVIAMLFLLAHQQANQFSPALIIALPLLVLSPLLLLLTVVAFEITKRVGGFSRSSTNSLLTATAVLLQALFILTVPLLLWVELLLHSSLSVITALPLLLLYCGAAIRMLAGCRKGCAAAGLATSVKTDLAALCVMLALLAAIGFLLLRQFEPLRRIFDLSY